MAPLAEQSTEHTWIVMAVAPLASVAGFFAAKALFESLGQRFFGKHLAGEPTRFKFVVGYAYAGIGLSVLLCSVFAAGVELLRSSLASNVFLISVRGFLAGGGMLYCLILLFSDGGIPMLVISGTRGRHVICVRRFRREQTKLVVERVLPSIMNCFGQFTVIEVAGEYARPDDAPEFVMTAGFPGPTPFLIPNYSEVWLKRVTRRRYPDSEWRAHFTRELDGAYLAVVDVSDYSPNVAWEMATLIAHLGASRLVQIAVDEPSARESIEQYKTEFLADGISCEVEPFFYPALSSSQPQKAMRNFTERLSRHLFRLESTTRPPQWLGCAIVWISGLILAVTLTESMRSPLLARVGLVVICGALVPLMMLCGRLKDLAVCVDADTRN